MNLTGFVGCIGRMRSRILSAAHSAVAEEKDNMSGRQQSRGKAGAGTSSAIVLAVTGALLAGGWYWLEGGNATSDDRDTAAKTAPASVASGERMVRETNGLFGGLGNSSLQPANKVKSNSVEAWQIPATPSASGPSPVTRAWVTGIWANDTLECESDAAFSLNENGRYSAYETEGSWSLEGDIVVLRTRYMEWGGDTVGPWKVERVPVVYLGSGKMMFGKNNVVRCPMTNEE